MARSIDQVVKDTAGTLVLQIVQLTAALEAAQERIAQLEADAKAKEPAPNLA